MPSLWAEPRLARKPSQPLRWLGYRIWTMRWPIGLNAAVGGGVFIVLSSAGCTGTIEDPGTHLADSPRPDDGASSEREPQLDPETGALVDPETGAAVELLDGRLLARIWRLSAQHHRTELERLLGPDVPFVAVPAGAAQHGFTNVASSARVDSGNLNDFQHAARRAAQWSRENALEVSGCNRGYGTAECSDAFLSRFLPQVFRRPVSAEEHEEMTGLFSTLNEVYGFDYAFERVVETALMSSSFLYRTELGSPDEVDVTTLTEMEIASALSFGIADHGPDQELREAARAERLREPAERERQARRLMSESSSVWQRFFWEWLQNSFFEAHAAEADLSPQLAEQMRREYDRFIEKIVVDRRGTLRDVLGSAETWIEPELAAHYGVGHPGEGVQPVQLDPARRAGLLTLGAWLVAHGHPGYHSVVSRGMGLYRDAMCNGITPPSGDVLAAQEELVGPDASPREIVEARGSSPVCGACHRLADPVGLLFENFAHDGTWRDYYDDGAPVESAVNLDGFGRVASAADFVPQLADDLQFQHCLVQRFGHFLLGADLGAPDEARWTGDALRYFVAQDMSLEELLVAIVRDPAFVERKRLP